MPPKTNEKYPFFNVKTHGSGLSMINDRKFPNMIHVISGKETNDWHSIFDLTAFTFERSDKFQTQWDPQTVGAGSNKKYLIFCKFIF